MSGVRYKVFLELGGDLPGDRLCALLQAIDRLGSINRAAAELKLSYRHAWGLIKKAEERLGGPLLQKRIGGAEGGGAELTAAARDLLARYQQFHAEVGGRLGQIFAPPPREQEMPPREQGAPPSEQEAPAEEAPPVLLASTIGPIEAGIVGALEDGFHRQTGILVRHIAAGTGQALRIAREGRADLVLTHAPQMEAEFVAAGFGAGRYPLMYNDFLVLGPAADPAGVRDAGLAAAAFRRIAAAAAPFVSRGDRSGTHVKELELWAAAGVSPREPWYRVYERGAMGSTATLRFAEQIQGYTLVDRAVYLSARARGLNLDLLLSGDPALRNEFALIPVSPGRFPRAQHEAARQFVAWATGPEGQRLIRQFGCDRYGEPLFFPAAPGAGGS